MVISHGTTGSILVKFCYKCRIFSFVSGGVTVFNSRGGEAEKAFFVGRFRRIGWGVFAIFTQKDLYKSQIICIFALESLCRLLKLTVPAGVNV